MKEIWFQELGYMSKNICETIKQNMQGRTYMRFNVSYSNCAGNCTLCCSTDYQAPESEIREFFIAALITNLALNAK